MGWLAGILRGSTLLIVTVGNRTDASLAESPAFGRLSKLCSGTWRAVPDGAGLDYRLGDAGAAEAKQDSNWSRQGKREGVRCDLSASSAWNFRDWGSRRNCKAVGGEAEAGTGRGQRATRTSAITCERRLFSDGSYSGHGCCTLR